MSTRTAEGLSATAQLIAGGLLIGGGVLLEMLLMARPSLWLRGPGVICGHNGLAVLHCPGCYVALATVIAGLALFLSALVTADQARPLPSLRRAVVRSRR